MTVLVVGSVTLFLALILVRAALFKPPQEELKPVIFASGSADQDKAAEHLAALVRCRTVAPGQPDHFESVYGAGKSENKAMVGREAEAEAGVYGQFVKLRALLEEFYPLTHRALERTLINEHSLLYRWKGRGNTKPVVLMAHYDVVPASDEQWQYPPFDARIKDGVIWGRGTVDTKATLCGIFEAVETLLTEGFQPGQDIYLAFGHDEETMGRGASSTVEYLKSRGLEPAMVLDEGGAIVENVFPGVKKPIAVVGLAEKGVANIEVLVESGGGHASTPGPNNPLSVLSKIILRLEKNPFKAYLSAEVSEMFAVLGRHMPFGLRIIFANLWCFKPLLLTLLPKTSRELNALFRSTAVFTMAEGSEASNVLPDRARAVANLRLAAADPLAKALEHVTEQALAASGPARKAKEPVKVSVSTLMGHSASPSTKTSSPAYNTLQKVIRATFADTIVTPYIMLAASDSRHYCAISDHVFRFSPLELSKEQLRSIHGVDEWIAVDQLGKVVDFYVNLIRVLEQDAG